MRPSALLLLLLAGPGRAAALVGLQGWLLREGAGGRIGVLDNQPLTSLLLPGESRRLHFPPGHQRDALLHAVEHEFGVVAMQLRTPGGNVPLVTPILEIASISDLDEFGAFAEVRCVGRARLNELHRRGSSREAESGSWACISPFLDARTEVPAEAVPFLGVDALVQRVHELHASCHALDRQLASLPMEPPAEPTCEEPTPTHKPTPTPLQPAAPPAAFRGVVKPVVGVGSGGVGAAAGGGGGGGGGAPARRERMARPPARFETMLGEQLGTRRATLLAQAGAQLMWPAPTLARLPLWSAAGGDEAEADAEAEAAEAADAADEADDEAHTVDAAGADEAAAAGRAAGDAGDADAERVLLSFAACAALGQFERLSALHCTVTADRLHGVAVALDRQRLRLAAALALRQAALG